MKKNKVAIENNIKKIILFFNIITHTMLLKKKLSGGGRIRKRRVRFRGSKKITGMSVQQVSRIARSVTLRAAETKSYLKDIGNTNQPDDALRVWNLNYGISQGTTAEGIVGEKLHLKNIRIQGIVNSATQGNSNTKTVRMLVFKTKKALATGTSGIDVTVTDVMRSNIGTFRNHVDLHKVDLLYDRTLMLTPNYNNQVVSKTFTINVPINKTEYFDTDNSGFLKDKNYYFAIQHYDGNGIYTPATHSFCYSVNFKDE